MKEAALAADEKRCTNTFPLLPLILWALLLFPVQLQAGQAGTSLPDPGNSGDTAAKLEKMRSAYQLFPLNARLKRDLAETYAVYGDILLKQRQLEQADENFARALELYPDEISYILVRGICNYYLKRYDIARHELGRLLILKPDSVDALFFLGLALYESDDRLQAMELWERARILAPGRSDIAEQLTKARRETAVEASMDRGHSSRFNLTYDPDVSATTAQTILDVLESAANQIGAELGHFPESRVPVAIYKRSDYTSVTASPDWSGGVYDGTIRLPFGAIRDITPPLRAILFHEYAHVVVFDLTRGNCPVWLNEGIAEVFGRRQFTSPQAVPQQTVATGAAADIRALEGSFSGLSAQKAGAAYQLSHSMVNYLATAYGWHRIKELLATLGKGMNMDAAVAATFQDFSMTYTGLINEWRQASQRGQSSEN